MLFVIISTFSYLKNPAKPMYIKKGTSLGTMIFRDSLADPAKRKIHPARILIF